MKSLQASGSDDNPLHPGKEPVFIHYIKLGLCFVQVSVNQDNRSKFMLMFGRVRQPE